MCILFFLDSVRSKIFWSFQNIAHEQPRTNFMPLQKHQKLLQAEEDLDPCPCIMYSWQI